MPSAGALQETAAQAKSRSMLVAVLVTSAIALLDVGTGDRASMLGLLIAGPLLAAASLDPRPHHPAVHPGPSDRVLLYTDGLVEARAPDGRPFALDGQVQAVVAASSLGAALDGLVARLLEHAGGRLDDDLALVLAQPRW